MYHSCVSLSTHTTAAVVAIVCAQMRYSHSFPAAQCGHRLVCRSWINSVKAIARPAHVSAGSGVNPHRVNRAPGSRMWYRGSLIVIGLTLLAVVERGGIYLVKGYSVCYPGLCHQKKVLSALACAVDLGKSAALSIGLL